MSYEYPSATIVNSTSAVTGRFGKLQANEDTVKVLQNVNLPEIFICSDVQMDLNKNLSETKIKVKVDLASGGKCMRCWKVVPEVKDNIELCNRCKRVLELN